MSKITYEGKEYSSIAELCKVMDVNPTSLYVRKSTHKESVEEAIKVLSKTGRGRKGYEFVFRGKCYPSIGAACKAFGLNQVSVTSKKTKLGISMEEAMEDSLKGIQPENAFEFRGKKYASLNEAIKELELPHKQVHNRKALKGESPSEVLEYFMTRDAKFIFRGQPYRSVRHACETLDVNYSSFTAYKSQYEKKITAEELLEEIVSGDFRVKFTFRGKSYHSIKQACQDFGINYRNFIGRKSALKLTTEEMLERYVEKKEEKQKNEGE